MNHGARHVSPYTSYILSTFLSLAAIVALGVAVVYAGRRFGLAKAHGPMHIVGQLPLDARRSIYLVRIGKSVMVIGASESGLTKLGDITEDEIPKGEEIATRFSDVMKRALGTSGKPSPKDPS